MRDHDHAKPPGQNYRGAAHNSCNLNYHLNKEIPIFFHNGKNYDNHFLMQAMIDLEERPKIIPTNTERYMSLTIKNLVTFVDSNLHLTSALDKLVKSLKDANYDFPITKSVFKGRFSREIVDGLIGKGAFLYMYWNHPDKMQAGFPDWEYWEKEGRTREDFERGLKTYNLLKCRNLGEYHDIYLELDVALLADVFEYHRTVMMQSTGPRSGAIFHCPATLKIFYCVYVTKRVNHLSNSSRKARKIFC